MSRMSSNKLFALSSIQAFMIHTGHQQTAPNALVFVKPMSRLTKMTTWHVEVWHVHAHAWCPSCVAIDWMSVPHSEGVHL